MLNILWLQHFPGEDLGTLGDWCEAQDLLLVRVSLHLGGTVPASPAGYDAIISMGGPMSVNDTANYPWIEPEISLLRQAMEAGIPVLGICLGAQLIARAAGAGVEKNPDVEVGWHEVELTPQGAADPLFAGLPGGFTPLHWHGETFALPAGAQCLARSELCQRQAFRLGETAYGLQFHPEVTAPMVAQWADDNAAWLGQHKINVRAMLGESEERAAALLPQAQQLYANWLRAVGCGDVLGTD